MEREPKKEDAVLVVIKRSMEKPRYQGIAQSAAVVAAPGNPTEALEPRSSEAKSQRPRANGCFLLVAGVELEALRRRLSRQPKS
jgi:hypothetical protein